MNIYKLLLMSFFYVFSSHCLHASEIATLRQQEQPIDSLLIIQEQNKLIAELKQQQEDFELTCFFLIGFLVFLFLLFGILYLLQKRGDNRLNTIINLLKEHTQEKKNNPLSLDDKTITAILENLKLFEKEQGFLNQNLSLHQLAKKLHTNTKYASKVINNYKLKSFRKYINDLRIQYSIQQLKSSEHYRKYTVSTMANEAGFSTRESFTKAFRKRTGETVTGYVEKLNF
ncbi:helix-turn-helix domain-containing protein [Kordia zhangzhouensis]|uniref:helix-turn-helix domain-containing protein n=1 Tax=Kordia zhangzhouensis TaxID=1620405 RepID=UPI0009E2FE0A|nr:helix-turn-helix domain-containing protein [Kordia zhangzhouensis]